MWELKTGKELLVFRGHAAPVGALAVSPDGRWVVSGGEDKMVRLWELDSGREVAQFSGHRSDITAVGFVKKAAYAFSFSYDPQGHLWRLPPREGAEKN